LIASLRFCRPLVFFVFDADGADELFDAGELFADTRPVAEDFLEDPPDFEEADADLVLDALVPDGLRVEDLPVDAFCPAFLAASPSATIASPAPCRAPTAAPAAAFATTSPAPFATDESTSPAESFAFCINPLEVDFDDLFVAIFTSRSPKAPVCMRAINSRWDNSKYSPRTNTTISLLDVHTRQRLHRDLKYCRRFHRSVTAM
jgi:hypothetical protein